MLAENIHFNVPQETFTLFYAITWGTAANSQPRWKSFAWGAIGKDPPSERRAWMSVAILNVLPLAYFVFILWWLSARAWEDISAWDWAAFRKIFVSILPALAPFGFYRVWTSIVERWREIFYGPLPLRDPEPCEPDNRPPLWKKIGIRLEVGSELHPDWARLNFIFGMIYIFFGPAFLLGVWLFSR
jgi:hypothetical protein